MLFRSHSFAAQIRGEKGAPREWVYVELNGKSYVRDNRYKLTNGGELFDLSDAPFTELAVNDSAKDSSAAAARKKLQATLDQHPTAPAKELADKAAKKAKRKARKQQ